MDAVVHNAKHHPIQEMDTTTDSRDYLGHARRDAESKGYDDWLIVDIDAHHVESVSWSEVTSYIEDPVVRHQAMMYQKERIGAPPYGLNGDLGLRYQDVGGRIPHQSSQREKIEEIDVHRDVVLTRRAMHGLALDYMVLFPTPMLFLGMHPQTDMEVFLCNAYNRWLTERIVPGEPGIVSLAVLPFNTPDEALKTVEKMATVDGVIGFCVTSTRYKPVHSNEYMKLYRTIEETGKPIAFHAGYHWQDPSLATCNTFLGMHALGFAWCNIVHMTNWILNGIPERFPQLKSLWVESGLSWVPFLMQRLDDQYLMRQSEAPLLKRMPSEYMAKNCWYPCQPMEKSNIKGVECTFEMINAHSQLLYASDWPHFDFDTPSVIYDLPFLDEKAKRNILGLNAARLFGLNENGP
ncbi:MAG: amidohydrolase [Rhodospirillaceae bacterium]|nr:amidohydrolase [Rhodospirillaceae bacterium]